MIKKFTDNAWEDYLFWQETDRRIVKRIHQLLRDIERNGNSGLGKPEPLRHELQGFWSRRINAEHRLIYAIEGDAILIVQCRFHYDK